MIEFKEYQDGTIEVIYEGVGTLGWLYYSLGEIELTLHENTDIESVEQILTKMKALQDTACNMQGENNGTR